MEIKVMIEASELAGAINNLAAALRQKSRDEPIKRETSEPISISQTQLNISPSPNVPLAPAPTYTIEQIMKAGATLMDAGKIDELRKLIDSFGVEAVTNLKPEQLGAFATELRKLGAKI